MKKSISYLIIAICTTLAFAGGQKETGRNVCSSTADAGLIIDEAFIDKDSYINAYAFPYKAHEQDELSIYLFNNKISFLSSGGTQSLILGLRANSPTFFDAVDVNYIIYIQNPSFLSTDRSFKMFETSLLSIMDAKTSFSRIGLFSAQTGSIRFIKSKAQITSVLQEIAKETKLKQYLTTASRIFSAIHNDGNTNPWRCLWITDENVLQNHTDLLSFKALYGMYNTLDTSFSLVCYGNSPQWATINTLLSDIKGNSYYGKTYQYLENTIQNDFIQFSTPAVSNITLTIAPSPLLGESSPLYIDVGSLGAGQSIMILQDLSIPPYDVLSTVEKNENFSAAYCYINYYSHKDKKQKYQTITINASYTDSIDEWMSSINPIALKYSTLASTGKALSAMSKAYKQGNYSQAFYAIDTQLSNLLSLDAAASDVLIRADIQLLEKTRSALFTNVQNSLVLD